MTKAKLNILSFNLSLAPFLWRPYARIHTLSDQIEVKSADIIILQEVHTYDMLVLLRQHLRGFAYVSYKHSFIGPKSGLVTFSRFPLYTEDFVTFPGRKGILISNFNSAKVVNVHLIAHTDGDWSTKSSFHLAHKMQLDQLNEQLHKEQRVILSGDFNLAKTSDLYERFVAEGKWQDTTKQDDTPTFRKEFLPHERDPQQIDYIFVRGDIRTRSAARIFEDKVDGMFLSNHMGLAAQIEL